MTESRRLFMINMIDPPSNGGVLADIFRGNNYRRRGRRFLSFRISFPSHRGHSQTTWRRQRCPFIPDDRRPRKTSVTHPQPQHPPPRVRSRIAAMVILSTWSFISITAFASQIFANTLHEHMDVDGLRTLFHVEHHSEVPVYEVISLHSIAKRDADGAHKVRLKAFGEHHDLQLEPSDRLFTGDKLRAWTAHHNATTDTVHYTELPNDEHIGVPYQDVGKRAAVVLHNDHEDGTILMEGTIGDHLVVKPVPAVYRRHVQSTTPDDEMFLDRDGDNEVSNQGFPLKSQKFVAHHKHVVYRRNPETDRTAGDYALMEPDALPRSRRKRSITKREAPYAIYPEIMVIVDYDGYRLHGGDNVQIKRYFVSFWNGVDLRYRLLKGPKIRISIAGIIISRVNKVYNKY
ncbi:unnamed protein product [Macrosiphum euphorbiae]|uniref:Uncharacterized protein n=1 Tax=Macrosiphum euphorbiae TaxID=13131 RepID=A0AAV0X2W3_9HEMI|nr:unnamed protein product [Macrosiphum euphorbiae]